jgi:hypothetical protein
VKPRALGSLSRVQALSMPIPTDLIFTHLPGPPLPGEVVPTLTGIGGRARPGGVTFPSGVASNFLYNLLGDRDGVLLAELGRAVRGTARGAAGAVVGLELSRHRSGHNLKAAA